MAENKNLNLSRLTGYAKLTKKIIQSPTEVKQEEETPLETNQVVEPVESTVVEEVVTKSPEETIPEEETQEEVIEETQDEEPEDEEEETEEEESDDIITEDEDTDADEREIIRKFNAILKSIGKSELGKLQKKAWFSTMLESIEEVLVSDQNKTKKLQELLNKKTETIEALETEMAEERRKKKLETYELSRYSLDDDDQYILDLKSKRLKEPDNQIIKDKERDEYLRRISELDPNFDMFETRSKLLDKRTQGIGNLSASNRSGLAPIPRDQPVDRVKATGYPKGSRR